MNQAINQKLITTSKTMLFTLRLLLVIFILGAIIPWVIPDHTEMRNSILSTYAMSNSIVSRSFSEVANFTLLSRIFGFIGSVCSLLPLLIGTVIMLQLFKNYAVNNVFSMQNAKLYSKLGIVYLLSAVLFQPLSDMFFSLCVSINNPVGHKFIALSLTMINLSAIFFAIVLIVIGQVMQLGYKINQEQELTV